MELFPSDTEEEIFRKIQLKFKKNKDEIVAAVRNLVAKELKMLPSPISVEEAEKNFLWVVKRQPDQALDRLIALAAGNWMQNRAEVHGISSHHGRGSANPLDRRAA